MGRRWSLKIKVVSILILDHMWRKLYNRELEKRIMSWTCHLFIRTNILEWIGHAIRIDTYRIPKSISNNQLEGNRLIGRPRNCWWHYVQIFWRNLKYLIGRRGQWRNIAGRAHWVGEGSHRAMWPEKKRIKVRTYKIIRTCISRKKMSLRSLFF